MVKLRLKRFGRRNHPLYRIIAVDERAPRDGAAIEVLGTYAPRDKDEANQVKVNTDRAMHWLALGAQPSDTVRSLLRRSGVDPIPGKPKRLEAAGA